MFHRECFARYLGLAYLGLFFFLDKRVPDFLSYAAKHAILYIWSLLGLPPPPEEETILVHIK